MRPAMTVLLLSGLLMTFGCTLFQSKESIYLRSAANQATQEQVRQQLGTPRVVRTTRMGEPVWVYEVRDIEPMSQSSWSTLGSWCDEYTLRFDKDGVLRDWTHQSFVHGGELMPLSCNSTLGVEKPAL
ncbi:MAG: hypothetical protein OJF52_000742 [Nitrospira sp.]|jgi:hypothetical protein|nr:MAG: hypothetical protein OJF52_000742 [Nitrospira sp.]